MAQKDITIFEAAQGQAHRGRPDRRRAVQLHRRAARHLRARRQATCSGCRSAPTSAGRAAAPDQPADRRRADHARRTISGSKKPASRRWRISPTTSRLTVGTYIHEERIAATPEPAGAHHQGARRGDQALLRRQGVRRQELHRVRQAAGGRRRAHLRSLQERQHLRPRAATCWRPPSRRSSRSRSIRASPPISRPSTSTRSSTTARSRAW